MANDCTNMFYATIKVDETTDRHEEIYQKIVDFLEENEQLYHTELDVCFIEAEFGSRWVFPHEKMEEFTNKLQEEYPKEYEDLYMRCLSYEFGCEYVDYMIFENGKWYSKIDN